MATTENELRKRVEKLEVYAKVMERKRDVGARMDELVRGADWARMGTNEGSESGTVPIGATETA